MKTIQEIREAAKTKLVGYTEKEIESFVDVEMIPEILDVFFGISGYKKKLMENQKNPLLGMSSVPA